MSLLWMRLNIFKSLSILKKYLSFILCLDRAVRKKKEEFKIFFVPQNIILYRFVFFLHYTLHYVLNYFALYIGQFFTLCSYILSLDIFKLKTVHFELLYYHNRNAAIPIC